MQATYAFFLLYPLFEVSVIKGSTVSVLKSAMTIKERRGAHMRLWDDRGFAEKDSPATATIPARARCRTVIAHA